MPFCRLPRGCRAQIAQSPVLHPRRNPKKLPARLKTFPFGRKNSPPPGSGVFDSRTVNRNPRVTQNATVGDEQVALTVSLHQRLLKGGVSASHFVHDRGRVRRRLLFLQHRTANTAGRPKTRRWQQRHTINVIRLGVQERQRRRRRRRRAHWSNGRPASRCRAQSSQCLGAVLRSSRRPQERAVDLSRFAATSFTTMRAARRRSNRSGGRLARVAGQSARGDRLRLVGLLRRSCQKCPREKTAARDRRPTTANKGDLSDSPTVVKSPRWRTSPLSELTRQRSRGDEDK